MNAYAEDAEGHLFTASNDDDLWATHVGLNQAEEWGKRGAKEGSRKGRWIAATARKMRKMLPPPPPRLGTPVATAHRDALRAEFRRYQEKIRTMDAEQLKRSLKRGHRPTGRGALRAAVRRDT